MVVSKIPQFILQKAKNQKQTISFQQGQLFHGKISKLFPNQLAEIQVGSQKLIAKLEIPLSIDMPYWFEVQSGEGQIHLKVIKQYGKAHSADSMTEAILKEFAIPITKQNQSFVQYMLNEKLPITKDILKNGSELLQIANDPQKGMAVLKEMILRQLPLSETVFSAVLANEENESLSSMMQRLQLSLGTIPYSSNVKKLANLLQTLTSSQQDKLISRSLIHLHELWLNEQENPSKRNAAMSLLQKTGIFPTGIKEEDMVVRLAESLISQTKTAETPLLKQLLSIYQSSENKQAIADDLHALKLQIFNSLQSNIDSSLAFKSFITSTVEVGKIPFTFQQLLLSSADDLSHQQTITTLFTTAEQTILEEMKVFAENEFRFNGEGEMIQNQLKDMIKLLGLDFEKTLAKQLMSENMINQKEVALKPLLIQLLNEQPPIQVKEQAEQLLNKLTGMQLLSTDQGTMQQLVTQIPLSLFSKTVDVTIQWTGRKTADGKIDPDYCRVLFYLELQALNETIIDMQVQNRILKITVFNEHSSLKTMAKPLIENLRTRLDSNGYKLSAIVFQSIGEESSSALKPVIQNERTITGVDFRV